MSPITMQDDPQSALPREPIQRLTGPLGRFLHVEAASGVVLMVAAAVAFGVANSPLAESFSAFWSTPLSFGIGDFSMDHSLKHWVSDALMAVFFFVVGLEVKRELVTGQLRDLRKAALPLAAALGGMVVPAAVYLMFQWDQPAASGWGIPMATDIAFVVGCMALLGPRVPQGLRIMLLSLAIADDIGAIIVIGVGYTDDLNLASLALGLLGIGVVVALQRAGVRAIAVYVLVGSLVWIAFQESGVHATIAGVILGLLTPARPWVSETRLHAIVGTLGDLWKGGPAPAQASSSQLILTVEKAAREYRSPLQRLERGIHPWSAFLIMPIFALANAGVAFEPELLTDPTAVAIAAGLLLGKPIGIVVFAWTAVRMGFARLPDGVGWGAMVGAGLLAGIGFTMSLFISGLALDGPALDAAKVGVLGASVLAAVAGMAILIVCLPKPARTAGDD